MIKAIKQEIPRQADPDYNTLMPKDPRVTIKDYTIGAKAFRKYIKQAHYSEYSYTHFNKGEDHPVFIKKALEHFIDINLLEIKPDDLYIDIASCDSPTPMIVKKICGCDVLRQDLVFPEGLHGDQIGGDASAMPIEDQSVDRLGLNSAFEHFEGDCDSRFIRECERVLKPGGKVCIVELFITEEFVNLTDPETWTSSIPPFDHGVTVYLGNGWRNRFGRFYDWDAFENRIFRFFGDMKFTMYNITNARKFHEQIHLVRAAIIEKPSVG